ncbi:MAG: hypothetical protein ABJG88_00080 [Litorimonas sp.]
MNTGLFFLEEFFAMSTVFTNGFEWGLLAEGFSATIDTAAWLLLLLVFELETFIIEDDVLEGWVGTLLKVLSFIFYAVIVYAFYGYLASLNLINGFEPVGSQIADYCAQSTAGAYDFVETLDDYVALNASNCQALGADAFVNAKAGLLATSENFSLLKKLTWIDIVNAAVWILIVLVLQAEIFFDKTEKIFKPLKIILYVTLFAALIGWLIYGNVLDVWDAALWLAAFFFIELNIVAWREEIADRKLAEGTLS